MSLQTSILVDIAATLTGSLDLEALSSRLGQQVSVDLDDGSGASQANKIWSDRRTLAAGASETLDLDGQTGAFGTTVAFATIKVVLIRSLTANTTALTVGAAASNGWVGPFGAAANTVSIGAGGLMLLVNPTSVGMPVVASTGDQLKIANGAGAAATYDIILIGA